MINRNIRKTREVLHIIDEPFLAKIYTKIMAELYDKGNSTPLPAVQSNEVQLLSKVSIRTDKNEMSKCGA